MRPELAVEPAASEKTHKYRKDKVKSDCSVVTEPFEIASQGFVLGGRRPESQDNLLWRLPGGKTPSTAVTI
jgi:hypothetical protein